MDFPGMKLALRRLARRSVAAFFKKVFHKVKLLSEYSEAGDLPEMIGTLLPVLPKGATICCTRRQKVYVDKRGKNHQGTIKLKPA